MTPHLQSVSLCAFVHLAFMAVQQTKRDVALTLFENCYAFNICITALT